MTDRFIAGVLDPQQGGIPSPIYDSGDSVVLEATSTALVSSTSCAVVWLPHRSPRSIFYMARITAAIASPQVIDATNGNPTGQSRYITIGPWQLTDPANHGSDPFVYLVLGTGSVDQSWIPMDNINRMFRPFNGMLSMQSADPPGTSTSSGKVYAFSVSDIRGMRDLNLSALAQSSLSRKDAVLSEKSNVGVAAFLASDIPIEFISDITKAPTNDAHSQVGAVYPSVLQTFYRRGIVFLAPGFGFNLIGTAAGGPVDEVRLPDFGWFECVDYTIYFGTTGVSSALTTQTDYITACDIFAYHSATIGQMTYDVRYTYYHPVLRPGGASPAVTFFPKAHHHRCAINSLYLAGDNRQHAQYIGTYFAGVSTTPAGGVVQIQPILRSAYGDGCTGPARILVYTSAGAPIEVSSVVNMQAKVVSSVTPYIQKTRTESVLDMNVLPVLSRVYDSQSMLFRRVQSLPSYRRTQKRMNECKGVITESIRDALPPDVQAERSRAVDGDLDQTSDS